MTLKVRPLGDRILVEPVEEEHKGKQGGIIIVDPKKVTRAALQNAASIAGLLLTTECLITEIPEREGDSD